MNWLDIVIALLIAIPAFIGYRKGFLRKVLGIAGIALGFILAVKFYDKAAGILGTFIKENQLFLNVIGFLLIVALLYGISLWLARFFSDMNSGTSIINKILGTAFGFLQGLIAVSVLLYNLSFINYPSAETRNSSRLYPVVYKVAPALFDKLIDLFPGLQDAYRQYKGEPSKEKK
jgi:membrane protein required for colicin V production